MGRLSTQKDRDRAKAWALAHPERRREIALKSYLKLRPRTPETPMERFERSYTPVTESGCWLWNGSTDDDGYGKTSSNGKDIRAHRWAWILHRGEIPFDLHVLHRCDVPMCVNPAHLFLGTNADNDSDKRRKGRAPKMAIHRETSLTEQDVLAIRAARGFERQVDLAERFGLHHSQVSRIQRGHYHAHVKSQGNQ